MNASAEPPSGLRVGSMLDRYELVKHIARGGMGSVWLARFAGKHGFTKHVAIKTIAPEFAENPQFHAMFLEEARISSKLAHANVAQVLDVGEHVGGVYIVFEWVEGRSLEDLCRSAQKANEPVPIPFVLRVLGDACAGLHAAHELADEAGRPLGIVHRDVTPGNVLVSVRGFAKVIDFGIAKARDRVHGETRSGFVKGTPQYMSPEHACREPIDRRSDVWSLGAVLYRTLSGGPPFPDHQALLAYIEGLSKLPELPPGVPADVRAIVTRALKVDRRDRYASADEMRGALERALHAGGESAEEVSAMASRLGVTARMDDAGALDSTELAIPSVTPADRPRAAAPPSLAADAVKTLASPGAVDGKSDRAKSDSLKPLAVVLVLAAVAALGAAALALCG